LARKMGTARHTDRTDCRCASCQMTRATTQCRHPNLCYKKAHELLNTLEDKWDPRCMQPEDFEEYHTLRERDETEGVEEFDVTVATDGELADVFRIFTEGNST
ncbi:hypothetical protein DFH06DRAFT_937079, partial [Mycena polygramma]